MEHSPYNGGTRKYTNIHLPLGEAHKSGLGEQHAGLHSHTLALITLVSSLTWARDAVLLLWEGDPSPCCKTNEVILRCAPINSNALVFQLALVVYYPMQGR